MVRRCDFCSGEPVVRCYRADSFEIPLVDGIVAESLGGWAACAVCHLLIQAGDRKALLERSMKTLIKRHHIPWKFRAKIKQRIVRLHNEFWAHRRGRWPEKLDKE